MLGKENFLQFIFGIFLVLLLVNFLTPEKSMAYGVGSVSPSYEVGTEQNLSNDLLGPVNDFLNTAKQISVTITQKNQKININPVNPVGLFGGIDNWFYNQTGFRLGDILKKIGNLIAAILVAIANAIRWLVGRL